MVLSPYWIKVIMSVILLNKLARSVQFLQVKICLCVCAHIHTDTYTNVLYSNCCVVILHIGPVSGSTTAAIPPDVPGVSIIAEYSYICSNVVVYYKMAHVFTQFYVHLKFSYY